MLDLNMQLPVRKFFQVMIGTTLLGGGISLNFLGNLGLGPWGAFHDGLSKITGISYGTAIILTGVFVTFLWIPLKQKPGIGTIVDIFWTGIVVDYFIKIGSTPELLLVKILFICLGVTLIGTGTAIYVGSNLGSGPRDGVMVGLESLGLKIGTARNVIEVTALILGWIMGGTVGFASVFIALSIGPVVQVVMPYVDPVSYTHLTLPTILLV